MKYFTLSPGFPSSSEVFCSTFFHKAVHDCSSPEITHACKCASTCINTARRTREETKYRKKKEKKPDLGMSLSVFYSYIILFCVAPSVAGCRETEATIRVWCDTLLRPLFCTTPANMQAHLSRALKPSLILWRPKHFNFFPTDQFTASPGLPVG